MEFVHTLELCQLLPHTHTHTLVSVFTVVNMVSCPHPKGSLCVCVGSLQSSSKLSPLPPCCFPQSPHGCCLFSRSLSILYLLLRPSLTPQRSAFREKQMPPMRLLLFLLTHFFPLGFQAPSRPSFLHPFPFSSSLSWEPPLIQSSTYSPLLYFSYCFSWALLSHQPLSEPAVVGLSSLRTRKHWSTNILLILPLPGYSTDILTSIHHIRL